MLGLVQVGDSRAAAELLGVRVRHDWTAELDSVIAFRVDSLVQESLQALTNDPPMPEAAAEALTAALRVLEEGRPPAP